MRQNRFLCIIYPLVLYFAVEQVMSLLLQMLPVTRGLDAVERQGIVTLVAFFALFASECVRGEQSRASLFTKHEHGKLLQGLVGAVLMLGCASVAMNNLLSFVHLASYSKSYQSVEQTFYSSGLLLELLVLGIITPIAEEYLYRGIIYRELKSWIGRIPAILVASLIFGLIHLNLVQFIYAAVLGLLLCMLTEYYHDIRPAMLGHMTANILSLLRGETDFLAWLTPEHVSFLPVTAGLFVLTLLLAGKIVTKIFR